MRLGFVVKPLARPELKSHDSRRWQNNPHLSVSLAYLRDVFGYLASAGITMYRMSSDLAPYATHPDMPQFHNQVAESAAELAELGAIARETGLRLSFHAVAATVINAPDPQVAGKRQPRTSACWPRFWTRMGMGPESVVVTHIGGVYGSPEPARERCAHAIDALPPATRSRLVVENDDVRFGVADALWVHARTGVPLVFDRLHHRLKGWGDDDRTAMRWPPAWRPGPPACGRRSTGARRERSGWSRNRVPTSTPKVTRTRWMYHADYVNPFEFIDFCAASRNLGALAVRCHAGGARQGPRADPAPP